MINCYELLATTPPDVSNLASPAEVDRLEQLIEGRRRGEVSDQFFLKARLQQGVYGMRGLTDVHMVRVKVPLGRLRDFQLERLALAAERYADGRGHVTTRQDVQLYHVPLADVPAMLRALGEAGLTTRETAGNVVRNITSDPLAGVSSDEVFDVWPYADQVMRFFLRNPISQNLPRKVKIAFSGSPADRATVRTHDIGGFAALRLVKGQWVEGFELYVGGGLGAAPALAQPLEVFTPADLLLPTLEAVIRVFDRLGNRENRARARLKFLVGAMGIDAFREAVFKERELISATESVTIFPRVSPTWRAVEQRPPGVIPQGDEAFSCWVKTNVVEQKQPGYSAIYVALPAGDVNASQLRSLAGIARDFAGGEVVISPSQNLVLRWVPIDKLPELYRTLAAIGLGEPGVHGLGNPVSCPGAATCPLAITTSHALAQVLAARWASRPDWPASVAPGPSGGLSPAPYRDGMQPALRSPGGIIGRSGPWWLSDDLAGVNLNISGCPNACGRHHLASIGLYGASRKIDGHEVPHYHLLLGGRVGEEGTRFGQFVARIPAKRVPEALEALVNAYRRNCQSGETFLRWIDRLEHAGRLKEWAISVLQPFLSIDDLSDFSDWGQQGDFTVKIGENECAA